MSDNGLRPVKAISGSLDTGTIGDEALRRRAQTATGHMIDSLRVEAALREQDGMLLDIGKEIDLRPWLQEEAVRRRGRLQTSCASPGASISPAWERCFWPAACSTAR